jgi:alpha-ketoglutarate-dependent taurine dioxygenase
MTYDVKASEAVKEFQALLENHAIEVFLEEGDLIIIDNYRMVHGRTEFQNKDPKLGGRHIRRVYAREKN